MALSNLARLGDVAWLVKNISTVVDWLDFFGEPNQPSELPRGLRPCTPKELDTAVETLRRMEYLRVIQREGSEVLYFERSVYADEIFEQVQSGRAPYLPPAPEST